MKKFFALALAVIMMLSMATFAVAEDKPVITIAVADKTNVEDFNTNLQTLWLEEQTGVDIQFEVYPSTDYNTKINMMIMTGGSELPDALFVGPSDAELLNWTSSGLLIPLTKYYEDKEASNYIWEAVERCGYDFTKEMVLGDGEIYAIPTFNQSYSNEYGKKVFMNTKFMEKLGITEAPKNLDELYDLFVKVKNTDLNGNGKNDEIPFAGGLWGTYDGWFNYIMNTQVYTADSNYMIVNDDETISMAYTTEGWKNGIKFIAKCFAENLIPKETLTQDSTQVLAMLNSEEPTSMMWFYISLSRINATKTWRTDFDSFAPMANEATGEMWAPHYEPSAANNGSFFITANCKNPDAAFAIGNAMASFHSSISTRFGAEGIDWEYMNDEQAAAKNMVAVVPGFPCTIYVYNDADFWSSGKIQNNAFMQAGPYIREYGAANGRTAPAGGVSAYDQINNDANDFYQKAGWHMEKHVGKLNYTLEEMEIISEIKPNLDTYMKEMNANFMAGNLDIDATWDSYLAELENIGLSQYLEVISGVYARMYGTK